MALKFSHDVVHYEDLENMAIKKELLPAWADRAGVNEVKHLIVKISQRLSTLTLELENVPKYEGTFIANIHALRLLRETPLGSGYLLPRCEVAFWEECFFLWLSQIKKLPKDLDREKLLESAKHEFNELYRSATNFPRDSWLSGIIKGFRVTGDEATGSAIYSLVLLRQDWSPCKLIRRKKKNGDFEHSLTFNQFELAEKAFAERDLKNDGYQWTELIKALLTANEKEKLHFDPESSMVSVSCDRIGFLESVRKLIVQFIEVPKTIDQASRRM